jgi:hypothetical protein
MADQKISQLTAATTPLAGTEVLPIVQSGVTKQVSVANLTAGRSTSVSDLRVITTTGQTNIIAGNTAGGNKIQAWNAAGNNDGYLGIEGFNIAYGQFTTAGNWAPANGLGIDFSATSGTGTSELLADYEEGTWTPTYTPASGAFGAITYNSNTFGRYTKVGNAVFIVGLIITDAFAVGTGTGQGRISGLPFTPSPSASASINYSTNFNLDTPTGSFTSGTDIFLTSRVTSNSSSAAFNSANFTTGASAFANYVYFQMNYVV